MATNNTQSSKKVVQAAVTFPTSTAVAANDKNAKQVLEVVAKELDKAIGRNLALVAESKKTLTTGKQQNQDTQASTPGMRHR